MINGGGKLEPGSHPDNDVKSIETLTGKHRDQIGKFFGDLSVQKNSVMQTLHRGPVVRLTTKIHGETNCYVFFFQASVAGPNYVKFLKDLADEQKFAVTYVELDEPIEGGG